MSPSTESLGREGLYNPLAVVDERQGSTPAAAGHDTPAAAPVLRVFSLKELLNYKPPAGSLLVGDGVIELGEIALLYGPPGSFKGFAVGHLMGLGAQGSGNWLGHPVNARFASLWINCENGRRRLRDQFGSMKLAKNAKKYIHVTDIPAVWNLADVRLRLEIRRTIVEMKIRLLIIDTVSNFTEDEFAKQFAAFFAALNELLQGLDPKPAVLLIHHSRKPKESDRGARGLLNLISGHQMLQRRARSVCYLGRVTDEFDERRVAAVWLKVSNNGEAEGTKTALTLAEDATLQPIADFDWSGWDGATGSRKPQEPRVTEAHICEVFEHGRRSMLLKLAVERLREITGIGRTLAYSELKLGGGRFSHLLMENRETGLISLRQTTHDASDGDGAVEDSP